MRDEVHLAFCLVGWPAKAGHCTARLPACRQATRLAPALLPAPLPQEVCRVANWLRSVGVRKGDSVAVYMPMVCEVGWVGGWVGPGGGWQCVSVCVWGGGGRKSSCSKGVRGPGGAGRTI